MNTVFQVKNIFGQDIIVSSSIGFAATVEPGGAFDINFPSDVHSRIEIDVGPVLADEPQEVAAKRARISAPTPPPPMVTIERVNAPAVKVAKPPSA